jgi:hypothetical protein
VCAVIAKRRARDPEVSARPGPDEPSGTGGATGTGGTAGGAGRATGSARSSGSLLSPVATTGR